jgi:hypothetical protein
MHTDWKKGTRSEVVTRFSQYEEALAGDYGGSPLIPEDTGHFENSPLLDRITDMARLCECLRGLNVVYTATRVIHGRPAIMVAKKNNTTPWYGLTLLLYTDKKTKRVGALKAGRAMKINGIDVRTKAEAEKFENIFAPEAAVQGGGGEGGDSKQKAASDAKGEKELMDVVTLDDFLS